MVSLASLVGCPFCSKRGSKRLGEVAREFETIQAQATEVALMDTRSGRFVAIEPIAERGVVCGDLDHGQAPGDAGLIARGAEFHQQFLARQLHGRQLLEPGPQPFQLPPPHSTWEEFAPDSPLEEAVLSELVSAAKFPASWENTGNFRYSVANATTSTFSAAGRHPTISGWQIYTSFPHCARSGPSSLG